MKPCLRCSGEGWFVEDGYEVACRCSMGKTGLDKPKWLRANEAMNLVQRAVPSKVRRYTSNHYQYALPHRGEANRLMVEWLRCGLKLNTGHPSMYFWGPTGTGKSVLAAEAARCALVDGSATTFHWLSEGILASAVKSRFLDGEHRDARATLKEATECDLLVIDEFTTQGMSIYSAQAIRVVADLLADRFDNERPTLMTSNREWCAKDWPTRLVSRWEVSVREVEIGGVDMRRIASPGCPALRQTTET